MTRAAEAQVPGRSTRCEAHPGRPSVGACEVCGRSVCLSCAVPVRGDVVGPECLQSVLQAFTPGPLPPAATRRGDRLALVGFSLVVALSVLPWSRFGVHSGFFEAWIPNWSLLAVLGAVAGVGFVIFARRRRLDALFEALVYSSLALLVWAAALLYHRYPPDPLSAVALAPTVALGGAAIALLGAFLKMSGVFRARRGT